MEDTTKIGKRIYLDEKNMKRLKILTMLFENETKGLNEKKKIDYVINKAIESYYGSSEIKEMLEL